MKTTRTVRVPASLAGAVCARLKEQGSAELAHRIARASRTDKLELSQPEAITLLGALDLQLVSLDKRRMVSWATLTRRATQVVYQLTSRTDSFRLAYEAAEGRLGSELAALDALEDVFGERASFDHLPDGYRVRVGPRQACGATIFDAAVSLVSKAR